MNICIVLPRSRKEAIGGYKIAYEYANRFVERGHTVSILFLNSNYLKRFHIPQFVKRLYFTWLNHNHPKWFVLNPAIRKVSDYSVNSTKELYAEADVAIATAVNTADYVCSHFQAKKKIYLIQGRENWSMPDKEVDNTYRLGMRNVVISKWLKEIVDRATGTESTLIQNPIDIEKYKVINNIKDREEYTIACLYNPNPCKGFNDSFSVLLKLKDKYPRLKATIFGAYNRPAFFPEWIQYVKNATQDETIEIYNSVRIFLCSSLDEGYGLTGLESMACGCALCSTDYNAVHEYANDGINCLLSPVSDVDAQVKNIERLFGDDELRIHIAETASANAKEFSWDKAMNQFDKLIS